MCPGGGWRARAGPGGSGDADFLHGPKKDAGEDGYVVCEINVSSTFAFPEMAVPTVAEAAVARVIEHKA